MTLEQLEAVFNSFQTNISNNIAELRQELAAHIKDTVLSENQMRAMSATVTLYDAQIKNIAAAVRDLKSKITVNIAPQVEIKPEIPKSWLNFWK